MNKRINDIISLVPNEDLNIYDLFCDHGLIGRGLLDLKRAKTITFVDIKKHLIEKLRQELKETPNVFMKTIDARLINFIDHSFVIMAGVGGMLIIDCLKAYQKQGNFSSLTFFISANMHSSEVRFYLKEKGFQVSQSGVITERGRAYEYFIFSGKKTASEIPLFDEKIWNKENIHHYQHLARKQKDLQNKSKLTDNEKELLDQLTHFLK